MQRWFGRAGRDVAGALFALSLVVSSATLVGCTDDTQFQDLCQSDEECPTGFVCVEGRCQCASNGACAQNEFCNPNGFCQARIGCESSLDCPDGQFCDRKSGNCLDRERCTEDVQCPLNKVCDLVRFQCVDGCYDVGDCALGAVCECPANTSCSLNQCIVGPCGDNSYCRYGESCLADAEGDPKRCRKDERGPFCAPCQFAPGQEYCTGEQANFCLIDSSKPFGSYFCGVECEDDAQCPWGFGCSDVLILTQDTCGGGGIAECPMRTDLPCTQDSECIGGVCDLDAGKCRAICVGGESDVQGFCTCLKDTDCPRDICDGGGHCSLSRKQCDDATPCSTIYCKNVKDPFSEQRVGYCYIGNNCAPVEGVTCDVVRAQQP